MDPFSTLSLAQDTLPTNINTATAAELAEAIDGVGEVRDAAIIALRDQFGSFANLEQLLDVKGIGDTTLARIRSIIVLE